MTQITIAPPYSPLWKPLYSLIQKFIRSEPWNLFENEDVFMVQSPVDGQMYLCCTMGNAGEEFGLNAFRGVQGIRNFEKMIASPDNAPPDRTLMYELEMLSFSLAPRDYMEKQDLAVLKKLMLSFTGGRWPLLRNYRQHYFPWFLTEPEIETLRYCLEQTLVLVQQGYETIDEIRNTKPGEFLVRCKDNGVWISRKMQIEYPQKEEIPDIRLDDITMKHLLNLPSGGSSEEIDLIHLSGRILDREPPYYPLILAGVNEESFAQSYGIFPPFTNYFHDSCNALVQSFLSRGSKPGTVFLKDGSPFADVFEKIGAATAIRCKRCEVLPHVADFIESMDEAMEDGRFPTDSFK
ncbi:MAG: hypothetical protein JW795_07465 [Chitinivibrionales bacterium]|nr:hypothetical protein [Chitinivibrionales bacterium]